MNQRRQWRTWTGILLLIAVIGSISGCAGKKAAPQEPAVSLEKLGIIDMQQAIQAHPKFSEHQKLEQEVNRIKQQLNASVTLETAASEPALAGMSEDMAKTMNDFHTSLDQEFQSKMTAKQQQLNAELAAKAAELNDRLTNTMQQYEQEIEAEYQPRIFNIQLKLKTVQLEQTEMEALKKDMESLQQEKEKKLTLRQQELAEQMKTMMQPEQQKSEAVLNEYSRQLQGDLDAKAAAKQNELVLRPSLLVGQPTDSPQQAVLQQQLDEAEQHLLALEDAMIQDIRDKTAKIAVDRGLTDVVTKVLVNIKAVDVTQEVIAACKK